MDKYVGSTTAGCGGAGASHELSTEDLKLAAMLYMQRDTDQTPEQKVSWLQTWGSSGGNQKVPKRLCAEISRDADVREFKWPNLSSTMKRRDKDRRSRTFFLTWSRCIAHVSACRQMNQLKKVRQEIRDAAEKKRQETAESVAAAAGKSAANMPSLPSGSKAPAFTVPVDTLVLILKAALPATAQKQIAAGLLQK